MYSSSVNRMYKYLPTYQFHWRVSPYPAETLNSHYVKYVRFRTHIGHLINDNSQESERR